MDGERCAFSMQGAGMFDLQSHYKALYSSTHRECGFKGTSRADWQAWRRRFLPRLRRALGLDIMESALSNFTPHAEKIDSVDCEFYTREQWILHVEPTVPIPFYLLLPKNMNGLRPLVLTPHGHNHPHLYVGIYNNDNEKELVENDRDIAVQSVREGYVTISPTVRGFGDTRTREDRENNQLSSCRTQLVHGLLVGRTPIGERVWDQSRLIDWALVNLPIDRKRIAITGNSGGGTVSLFTGALDRRVTVSVPSCYFCTFEGSIGSISHCDCNYIPGIMRLGEMYDVAGLIAPRPVRFIAGVKDEIFPIEHVRMAFSKVKKIYRAAGAPDNCELYEGEGGHRYYRAGAWPFIRKCFTQVGLC